MSLSPDGLLDGSSLGVSLPSGESIYDGAQKWAKYKAPYEWMLSNEAKALLYSYPPEVQAAYRDMMGQISHKPYDRMHDLSFYDNGEVRGVGDLVRTSSGYWVFGHVFPKVWVDTFVSLWPQIIDGSFELSSLGFPDSGSSFSSGLSGEDSPSALGTDYFSGLLSQNYGGMSLSGSTVPPVEEVKVIDEVVVTAKSPVLPKWCKWLLGGFVVLCVMKWLKRRR